jgi:hypothetical protein
MKPMVIILIGAIITIVGGLVTAYGTYLQNRNSSQKSQLLLDKVSAQETTINELRKENSDLHFKLEQTSSKIFDRVRGGQNYIYVEVIPNAKSEPFAILKNDNKYPVYKVLVEVTDYEKAVNCFTHKQDSKNVYNLKCFEACSKFFELDELGVGEYYLNDIASNLNIETKVSGKYQIRFKTRYKKFYQLLIFKKVDRNIISTSQIYEEKNGAYTLVHQIKSNLLGWEVDFDKEFHLGVISYMK